MTVPRAQALIEDYESNAWLIHRQLDGLTHEDSLLQPPFEANCLNWVVGHIVSRRNSALQALGRDAIWPDDVWAKYRTGSDPIREASQAQALSALLEDLDETGRLLRDALEQASEEDLQRIVENDRGTKAAWEHLAGFHWHETYHIGQLDVLKAMAMARRQHQPS